MSKARATGVRLEDGRNMSADLVVANADLPYVYSNLLPEDGSAAKLAQKEVHLFGADVLLGRERRKIPRTSAP